MTSIEEIFKEWGSVCRSKEIKDCHYTYEEMLDFAKTASDTQTSQLREALIDKTHSMEEFGLKIFGSVFFKAGILHALNNMREHIKKINK
jgi:hypothetical protein